MGDDNRDHSGGGRCADVCTHLHVSTFVREGAPVLCGSGSHCCLCVSQGCFAVLAAQTLSGIDAKSF
jgi:hypothetical protein